VRQRLQAQGEDVLCRLLAEEVVDPVNRVLGQDVVQSHVELPGTLGVVSERLLDHQRAALRDPGLAEHLDHVAHGSGRDRQVHETITVGADRLLGAPGRLGQILAVVGAGDDKAELDRELLPAIVELAAAVLLQRLADLPAEIVIAAR
jgi:hypothetical protein